MVSGGEEHFLQQYQHVCDVSHTAVKTANQLEIQSRQIKNHAEELQFDVEKVSKETNMIEDELSQINMAIYEAEKKIAVFEKSSTKSSFMLNEMSRSKQIEEELTKAKAQEEANTIKYQEIQERLVEERKQTKIDDKEYYDIIEAEEKVKEDLMKTLQSAEDYTTRYEEVKRRILIKEDELRKQLRRGDKAEEEASIKEKLLSENLKREKEMTIENLENGSNEDNLLEDVRQKRAALFAQEERLEFALRKQAENQEIADDLRAKFAAEQEKLKQLQSGQSN